MGGYVEELLQNVRQTYVIDEPERYEKSTDRECKWGQQNINRV